MKEIFNYNIHDNLTIKLNKSKKFDLMKGLDLELSPFRVQEVNDPDIIFNVGKFTPSNDNCYTVDHKYFVKDNYFYCKDSSGKMKWEVEFFGFEKGKMVVNYNYKNVGLNKIISRNSSETFLLRSLIYLKLTENKCFMIHSAGINKNNQAYIFPGRGGSFKTSLVMDFVKRGGFDYLGDDRVILQKDNVLNYPSHISLFDYTYTHKNDEHLSFWDKIDFIKSLWRQKNSSLNIPIVKSSKLSAVFFVVKMNNYEEMSSEKIDIDCAVDKLIESAKFEMSSVSDSLVGFTVSPFYRYMLAYSYVFPDSTIAKYWDELKFHFRELLKTVPIYEIKMPQTYEPKLYENLLSLIEEIK